MPGRHPRNRPPIARTRPRIGQLGNATARHLIENFFAKIKQFRAIATRYEKTALTSWPPFSSLPASFGLIDDKARRDYRLATRKVIPPSTPPRAPTCVIVTSAGALAPPRSTRT